ncbi:hypothetical protein ACEOAV_26510, partial [Escherichia coli]
MLPRFADIFQQGNRWLNWLEKQPEGSVRPVVIESVTKIMACGTTLMGYTHRTKREEYLVMSGDEFME